MLMLIIQATFILHRLSPPVQQLFLEEADKEYTCYNTQSLQNSGVPSAFTVSELGCSYFLPLHCNFLPP